jgi:multiple sugar transport system permease protein
VIGRAVVYLAVVVIAVLFFTPFLWTITTSLKRVDEVYLYPPTLFPQVPQFGNYPEVFQQVPFGLWFRNSAIIAVLGTLGTVCSTTVVAYGFARKRFPGRQVLFLLVLSTMILPGEVTIIPQYLVFQRLGWVDTFLPLIVPGYLAVGAFYIFLMRQFILTIPLDFDHPRAAFELPIPDEAKRKVMGLNAVELFSKITVPAKYRNATGGRGDARKDS